MAEQHWLNPPTGIRLALDIRLVIEGLLKWDEMVGSAHDIAREYWKGDKLCS
jgi:hypothetical protein